MAYNINNFVKVVNQGDRNLQIIDNSGTVRFSVNPYQVLNVAQNNNLLKINLKSGRVITLDFQNSTEAIESVLIIQQKIDDLVTVTPFTIDKDVENWVEDVNLITPEGGTLSIWGHLLPGTTSTYNLGSPTYEWHTLYVGSQSLVIGGVTISSANNSIILDSINLGSELYPILITSDGSNLLINGTPSSGSVGATGATGPQGTQGITGPQGPVGATGAEFIVSNFGNNRILTSDGTATGSIAESNLTFDGYNFTITGTSSFSGHTIFQQTSEVVNSNLVTTPTVTYDFNLGSIWYHGTVSNNFTADFINLPTTNNRVITTTIIISQGATGYSPEVIRIDGITQSLKWANGTYSVSTNKVDIVGLSFLRLNNNWQQVMGQISSFS